MYNIWTRHIDDFKTKNCYIFQSRSFPGILKGHLNSPATFGNYSRQMGQHSKTFSFLFQLSSDSGDGRLEDITLLLSTCSDHHSPIFILIKLNLSALSLMLLQIVHIALRLNSASAFLH